MELKPFKKCPPWYFLIKIFWDINMLSHNVVVILNVFIVCNKNAFFKKLRSKVTYMLLSGESFAVCELICSFIPQALIECLLCPRHCGSWTLILRSSQGKRNRLVNEILWHSILDMTESYITQYVNPNGGQVCPHRTCYFN